jgi:transcriptional regulator with XRE-family HTH domain
MSARDQHVRVMDGLRVGRSLRALRIRANKRQHDVSVDAGVSRQQVSRVESGDIDGMTVGSLTRIGASLGATVDVIVRWHGEGLDRLLDAAHAAIVERVVRIFQANGWETAIEVTFNVRGERGSVDVCALHPQTATVVITEVKTVVPDAGSMLLTLDRKARLAPEIARSLGWPCRNVGRLLVIGDSSTTRRRVASLGATFAAALPQRAVAIRRWLRAPAGPMAGLWFLPYDSALGTRRSPTGRQRVRTRRS